MFHADITDHADLALGEMKKENQKKTPKIYRASGEKQNTQKTCIMIPDRRKSSKNASKALKKGG